TTIRRRERGTSFRTVRVTADLCRPFDGSTKDIPGKGSGGKDVMHRETQKKSARVGNVFSLGLVGSSGTLTGTERHAPSTSFNHHFDAGVMTFLAVNSTGTC